MFEVKSHSTTLPLPLSKATTATDPEDEHQSELAALVAPETDAAGSTVAEVEAEIQKSITAIAQDSN